MSNALDTLKEIGSEIGTAVSNGVMDVKAFLGGAATYASQNIGPELLKIATDSMTAAETAFAADNTVNKYEHALAAAISQAAADGIAFIEADYNFAVEAVKQEQASRIAAAATADNSGQQSSTGTGTGDAAGVKA